jgi:cell division transport system ATP-binding protein
MNQSEAQESDTGSDSIVQFQRAGFRYGPENEALREIDLNLRRGGFYFLTGPSGAGKSTLLKLMYLALRPTRGRVKLFGTDIGSASREALPLLRRKIGVVFQDFRLLPHMSVAENVSLPFRVKDEAMADYQDDVVELLKWVGLGNRLHALPSTLSGGEQQRVAIARAVVCKPSLLIADEPTGNVDPAMGAKLMRLFVELHRYGTTVVIATHDLELVRRSGAPVIRIEAGQMVEAPH